MSFLTSLLPIAGGAIGSIFGPVGAGIGANLGGALGAGLAQNQAGNRAQGTLQQAQANLAPWMQTGQQANTALGGFLGVGAGGWDPNAPGVRPFGAADFHADPGYNWVKDQGERAIMNRRSAMGGALSGGTLTDLTRFGQGLAEQQYQSAYNRYNQNIDSIYRRLLGLSGMGENAATNTGNLATGVAGVQQGIGNVQGATSIATGNAITNPINNWLLAQAIQQGQGGSLAGMAGGSGGMNTFAGSPSYIPAGFGGTSDNPWYG